MLKEINFKKLATQQLKKHNKIKCLSWTPPGIRRIKLFPRFLASESCSASRITSSKRRPALSQNLSGPGTAAAGSLGLVECIGLVAKLWLAMDDADSFSQILDQQYGLVVINGISKHEWIEMSSSKPMGKKPSAFAQLKPVSDLEPTPTRTPPMLSRAPNAAGRSATSGACSTFEGSEIMTSAAVIPSLKPI